MARVLYGEDIRKEPEHFIELLNNPIVDQKIRTEEDVENAREKFINSYQSYLEDHFFDDEILEMQTNDVISHDYYDDYTLDNEITAETKAYVDNHAKDLTDEETESERDYQEGDI